MTAAAENKWKRNSGGAVLAAAVLSYFSAPFIPLTDPFYLLIAGVFLSLASLGFYNIFVVPGVDKRMLWFAYPMLFIGLLILSTACVLAAQTSWRLDTYCATLQNEMLRGQSDEQKKRGASTPHDAFAALRCRPQ